MENYFEKVSAMREMSRNSKARKIAAKEMRNERIDELKTINYRVKPTKGIDNGAGGKIAELEETREGSEKARGAGASDDGALFPDGAGGALPVAALRRAAATHRVGTDFAVAAAHSAVGRAVFRAGQPSALSLGAGGRRGDAPFRKNRPAGFARPR